MPDLTNVRFKLNRAHDYLALFQDELRGFLKGDPYELLPQGDPEPSGQKFVLRIKETLPIELIGNAEGFIQNLRTALDFLVWELSLLTTESPPGNTQFPVFLTPEAYKKQGRTKIRAVPSAARALIEELQPYNRRESVDPLWYVLTLSDVQKHRSLAVSQSDVRISWRVAGKNRLAILISKRFQDGDAMTIQSQLIGKSDEEMDLRIDPVFSISAQKGPERVSVSVDVLNSIYDYVRDEVIHRFEYFFVDTK